MSKSKVLAALAIAAALVVVGCSAVRCAAPHDAAEDQTTAPKIQDGQDSEAGGSGGESTKASTLDTLRECSWVAESGSGATLEFRDGAFVENGETLEATAFDTVSDSQAKSQSVLTIRPVRNGLSSADTAVILSGSEGSYRVQCDAFALEPSYVQANRTSGAFAVAGLNDEYLELAGITEAELTAAISEYCSRSVPSASGASFDGEVFIDMGSGLCSATFHANDAARTIVTVTSQGGKLTVAG